MGTHFHFNGRDYDSPDDLPPEVRDLVANALSGQGEASVTEQITVNGQTYDNVAAMPPAVRTLYEAAMAMAGGKTSLKAQVSGQVSLGTGGQATTKSFQFAWSTKRKAAAVTGQPRSQAEAGSGRRIALALLLAGLATAAVWWLGGFGR